MATWEDGPEYAPIERPAEFQQPEAAPLDHAPPRHHPSAGAPLQRPEVHPPQQPVAELATLVVDDSHNRRDPAQPFAVVRSIMTDTKSAWSAAHAAGPEAHPGTPPGAVALRATPNGSSSWPAPGGYPQGGPGHRSVAAPPLTLTAGNLFKSLTPAVLIALVLGCLISPVAPISFVVAWILAQRITVSKKEISRVFLGLGIALLVCFGILLAFGSRTLYSSFSMWALGACWLALLASIGLVATKLRSTS